MTYRVSVLVLAATAYTGAYVSFERNEKSLFINFYTYLPNNL